MMIGGQTTYDSITKRTTKEEDATGSIPLVQQQQDHEAARFLIEEEVGAADGRRNLLLLFRRSTIQTRSLAAILVGILVGASVLVALSATDRSGGGLGSRVAWRSSSRTDNVVGIDKATATVSVSTALATVTLDDSCATEVPGAGPCCDGGTITSCFQVCDYLLMCDNGYVPEQGINDDAATQFPETSDYQPHNCHCRGYEDHNGCFCRQLRDMIEHSVKGAFVGECDPCLPPPTPSPTHSPTARTAYIPLRDLCFEDKDNYGKYCWYPAGNFPDPIFRYPFGNWKLSDGRSYYDCGPKCSKVQIYDPDQDDCFSDNLNYDKYCWYGSGDGIPVPVGQWTRVTGRAYHDSCGLQCEDVMDIGG